MEYKEQNKGSLDGVTRRFELECCTFMRRQIKYSAKILNISCSFEVLLIMTIYWSVVQ